MRSVNYSIALCSYIFDESIFNKSIEDRQFHSKTIRLLNLLIKTSKEIFKTSRSNEKSVTSLESRTSESDINLDLNSGNTTQFAYHLLSDKKLREINANGRDLIEILKNNNETTFRRELQLYSHQNCIMNLKVKKNKTNDFLIKTTLRKDELTDLNIKEYLKTLPKLYLNNKNNGKFFELLKLIDKNFDTETKLPEIEISSLIRNSLN